MTDASKQLWLTGATDIATIGETLPTSRALSRKAGGTGASVDTIADLLTHLGRNAASGFAGLDGSSLILNAQLPVFVGALTATDGTKGAVPAPLDDDVGGGVYQRFHTLRGDGGWSERIHLGAILTFDGSQRIVDFSSPNLPTANDSRTVIRSVGYGAGRQRIVAVGHAKIAQGDPFVDVAVQAAGTILVDNGAGYGVGASTIHVDGATTVPKAGDRFTLGGNTYQVTSASALVGTDTDLGITPNLLTTVADNDPLTFISGGYYQVGAMHVDGLTVAPDPGDVFTMGTSGTRYTIATASALTGSDCDITFTPNLTAGVADNDYLNFVNDASCDISLEPQGAGRVSSFGDPLLTTIKPTRRILAVPFSTLFGVESLAPPLIDSPGTALASLEDATGCFVQMTYDQATPLPCGLVIASALRRRHDFDIIFCFRSAFTQSRFWCGLFDADPATTDTLGSIKGVGIRYNSDATSQNDASYQFVLSSGAAETRVGTPEIPTANTIQALRLRHNSGTWEFAAFNFNTSTWQSQTTLHTNGPALTDTLGIYARLAKVSSTTNRALAIKHISVHTE